MFLLFRRPFDFMGYILYSIFYTAAYLSASKSARIWKLRIHLASGLATIQQILYFIGNALQILIFKENSLSL